MPWLALAATAVSTYGAVEKSKNQTSAIGAMQPKAPNMTSQPTFQTSEAVFDNSGWNIAFAGSRIDSTSEKTTSQKGPDADGAGLTAGAQGGIMPALQSAFGVDNKTLMYAGVGFLALMLWKKRKS